MECSCDLPSEGRPSTFQSQYFDIFCFRFAKLTIYYKDSNIRKQRAEYRKIWAMLVTARGTKCADSASQCFGIYQYLGAKIDSSSPLSRSSICWSFRVDHLTTKSKDDNFNDPQTDDFIKSTLIISFKRWYPIENKTKILCFHLCWFLRGIESRRTIQRQYVKAVQ
jgi:hypothetical protein